MREPNHRLAHDLSRMLGVSVERRRLLQLLAGASALPLLGCSGDAGTDPDAGVVVDAPPNGCPTIPRETAGPFPGDGTNGPNVLVAAGVVRSDIRTSFAGLVGTADGVPLTVTLTLVDSAGGCAPLAGYAVYLWHPDRAGDYSIYAPALLDQNYLRGVQVTDAAGQVTFTTIFPGCYPGRWPHAHLEIYRSLAVATAGGNAIVTSQLALPRAASVAAYAAAGYATSATNLVPLSLATDGSFRDDGAVRQLASVTGSVAAGFSATLTVGVPG